MIVVHTSAILLTLVALSGYLNYRYVRLPNSLVVLIVAVLASLAMLLLGKISWDSLVYQVNVSLGLVHDYPIRMQTVLSLLLFAAAIQINLQEFKLQRLLISSVALIGSVVSMFVVGSTLWLILQAFGINITYGYCLLFGVVTAPTDSTSMAGALRAIRLARSHETTISGESIVNNAINLVLFFVVMVMSDVAPAGTNNALWLVQHLGGGVVWGLVLGWVMYHLLKNIEQHMPLALWLTFSLAMGGGAGAYWLDLSAPLALLVAGLYVARADALPESSREQIKTFWGVLAEILVVGLVIILGLELLRISIRAEYLLIALAVIPMVLLARFAGVGIPLLIWQRYRRFSSAILQTMTWGALHGGMSVSLVLSIPEGPSRDMLLVLTYIVIITSVIVQGLVLARILDEAG
ncbi:MAG: cation:proton antiporter [Gammaproteobacteria bacterium]|nr:cation:proton antiporter [Gammaproteobacteria bacterium]